MQHKILFFGDQKLRQRARKIEVADDSLRQLVDDMLETMGQANGLGLAAEQIGRQEAVCVIDVPEEMEDPAWREINASIAMPLVMLNPRIESSEGKIRDQEGCLSFPEIFIQVTRHKKIEVSYMDLEGKPRRLQAGGLLARAIQHEVDHLNGILLVDHMSPAQRVALARGLNRIRERARGA